MKFKHIPAFLMGGTFAVMASISMAQAEKLVISNWDGYMPKDMAEMPGATLQNLRLTQQCRPEDLEAVKAAYQALNFRFDLRPFFMDMPLRIANAHLVICRSGASTIAEL